MQVDKKTEEKEKTRAWLNDCLRRLNDWRNTIEAELEGVGTRKKRSAKANAAAAARAPETAANCRATLEDLKLQNSRLELMLRGLENDTVSTDRLNAYRDTIDAYLANPRDPVALADWNQVMKWGWDGVGVRRD
jgi:CCR4-NOT transcriptional regulation complex NOT5 subunit